MTEATGLIKIVSIPDGEAPEWVRAAWKGLTLKALSEFGFIRGEGAVTGTSSMEDGYIVPQDSVLKTLARANPKAARWWYDKGFPQTGRYFIFSTRQADAVSGMHRVAQRIGFFDRLDHPGRECDFCDGHVPYRK